MPHVSNRKLNEKTMKGLEKNLLSIIERTDTKTRVHIFDELFTRTEKIMLAKRISILFLLEKGVSLYEISRLLGISPSTAERFRNAVESRKYRHTGQWIKSHTEKGKHDKLIESLVALAFTGRTKSFKKFVDEL